MTPATPVDELEGEIAPCGGSRCTSTSISCFLSFQKKILLLIFAWLSCHFSVSWQLHFLSLLDSKQWLPHHQCYFLISAVQNAHILQTKLPSPPNNNYHPRYLSSEFLGVDAKFCTGVCVQLLQEQVGAGAPNQSMVDGFPCSTWPSFCICHLCKLCLIGCKPCSCLQ